MTKGGVEMKSKYAALIRERIDNAEDGEIFINSDFADITNFENIRKNLGRLADKGKIRRITNGIYEKPKYSKLLKENIAPDPHCIAKAIARSYNWNISPSGNTALNMLNLSTQVPATWSYISDGPYKTYDIDSVKIEFKHRTNKDISYLNSKTILVIEALKFYGEKNIKNRTLETLSKNLTEKEICIILKEAKNSTKWVYEIIRKIARMKNIHEKYYQMVSK